MDKGLDEKNDRLKDILRSLRRVLVTYSGGVDSTFLLRSCIDVLGKENIAAFIGTSPAYPEKETEEARNMAMAMGLDPVVVETDEMSDPRYVKNTRERCYFCKSRLMDLAWTVARERGFDHVLEGSNLDDMSDFRPGRRACAEKGVKSPLLEAGLTKKEIRELSGALGLPTFSKPSLACLASRIPYGTPIDETILKRIEAAEELIRDLGIYQVRVRYHGDTARIEVEPQAFETILAHSAAITAALKKLGFTYVALDLEGYRTGSMNES